FRSLNHRPMTHLNVDQAGSLRSVFGAKRKVCREEKPAESVENDPFRTFSGTALGAKDWGAAFGFVIYPGTRTLQRNARVRLPQVHSRGLRLCGRSPIPESSRQNLARPPNLECLGGGRIDAVQNVRRPRADRTEAIFSLFPSEG